MPTRPQVFRLVLLCFFFGFGGFSQAKDSQAMAGWAQVEITPPLGIAMGGRGGNYTLARQVLDPLYAQILYIKDSKGTGFALVSFDLVGLPHSLSDQLRQLIVYELGIEWNLVLLNTSHTHSGPNMLRELLAGVEAAPEIEQAYFESLRERITLAAREAKRTLQPIKPIEVFEGKSLVGINRRGRNKQGNIGILPDPNGPIDERLWGLRVSPEDGTAGALVFAYACHPVIVYGYAFAAISADFPGVARNEILKRHGGVEHVQFVQGLGGNVRPRSVADLNSLTFRGGSTEKLQQAGVDLANDVLRMLQNKGKQLKLQFAGSSDRPFLPRDEAPPRSVYEKMAAEKPTASNQNTLRVAQFWLKRYDSGEGFAKGEAWPIGIVQLDHNHCIVHMAGEPVAEWRPLIAKWMGQRKIVTLGYSQETLTYLPTESLLEEGGYEVLEANRARKSSPAPFAPGIEDAVRSSILKQLSFMEASTKSRR